MPSLIKTIYEDDYLLVVDKPSGLLVVPTPKKEKNTLTSILNKNANQKNVRLYPCHRLDRDTSGLIIYAKSRHMQDVMMNQFRKHKVIKDYIAFVRGGVKRSSGQIRGYITHDRRQPVKLAITNYKVIRRFKEFTQVIIRPETGRTNQIRIHFKQLGHPLLGERRFAFRKDFKIKFKRTALHAQRLEFRHPTANKIINLHSELPPDLEDLINREQ